MAKSSAPYRYRDGWRIKWIDETGQRKSSLFKSYAEAESALHSHKFEVEQIRKGNQKRIHEDKTFNDLCGYWLKNVAPTKRSYKDQQSIIENQLRPYFGKLKLQEITVEHTQKYILERSTNRSNKTIANHLIVLISMLNFSKDMKWLRDVPRIKKPKIPRNGDSFSYLRNDNEIKRFLEAAKQIGMHVHAMYAFAIFTGARQGEIAAVTWSDINLDTRRITPNPSLSTPNQFL